MGTATTCRGSASSLTVGREGKMSWVSSFFTVALFTQPMTEIASSITKSRSKIMITKIVRIGLCVDGDMVGRGVVVKIVEVVALVVLLVFVVVVDLVAVLPEVVVKHSGLIKSPSNLLQLMKTEEPSLYEITWLASRLNWLLTTSTTLVFSSTTELGCTLLKVLSLITILSVLLTKRPLTGI